MNHNTLQWLLVLLIASAPVLAQDESTTEPAGPASDSGVAPDDFSAPGGFRPSPPSDAPLADAPTDSYSSPGTGGTTAPADFASNPGSAWTTPPADFASSPGSAWTTPPADFASSPGSTWTTPPADFASSPGSAWTTAPTSVRAASAPALKPAQARAALESAARPAADAPLAGPEAGPIRLTDRPLGQEGISADARRVTGIMESGKTWMREDGVDGKLFAEYKRLVADERQGSSLTADQKRFVNVYRAAEERRNNAIDLALYTIPSPRSLATLAGARPSTPTFTQALGEDGISADARRVTQLAESGTTWRREPEVDKRLFAEYRRLVAQDRTYNNLTLDQRRFVTQYGDLEASRSALIDVGLSLIPGERFVSAGARGIAGFFRPR